VPTIQQQILESGEMTPGFYWIIDSIDDYQISLASIRRAEPNNVLTRSNQENADLGQVFVVVQLKKKIPYSNWPWSKWGAIKGDWRSTNGYSEGVWRQPGPDWKEDVIDIGERALAGYQSLGKNVALWALGIVGTVVVLKLLTKAK
jgi:hypothetical protein